MARTTSNAIAAPQRDVTFTSVQFDNFKALSKFKLTLDRMNILLGANNAGKSTTLAAFRVLSAGLRAARSRSPNTVTHAPNGERRSGWTVGVEDLPFSIENVHTNYNNQPAHVTFTLSNGNTLGLTFPPDGGCALYAETEGKAPATPSAFREAFPVIVGVVPVLGPVEHEERLLEKQTVSNGLATHRAARHFRSFWYHFPEHFADFAKLVADTWPGMSISPPEFGAGPSGVYMHMFCSEDRIDRELYWVGFGFQIWCQLLTHIVRSQNATLLVLDEPETYLHPDVQRKLLSILRKAGPDVLVATHSSEIISEAEPHELVLINKREHEAHRLTEIAHVQRALDRMGSLQNVTVTHLARTRRVLFAHPDDLRVMQLLALRLGMNELAQSTDYTVLNVGRDFRASTALEVTRMLAQTLGKPIAPALLGPASAAEAADKQLAFAARYPGTELLNAVLTEQDTLEAILEAIQERSRRHSVKSAASPAGVQNLLDEVLAQHAISDRGTALATLPAQQIIDALNARISREFGARLSLAGLVQRAGVTQIEAVKSMLGALDQYRRSSVLAADAAPAQKVSAGIGPAKAPTVAEGAPGSADANAPQPGAKRGRPATIAARERDQAGAMCYAGPLVEEPSKVLVLLNHAISGQFDIELVYLAVDGELVTCRVHPIRVTSPPRRLSLIGMERGPDERRTYYLERVESVRLLKS